MARYIITCERCEFEEIRDDDDPPGYVPEWEDWDAKSAAKGARDNHAMSEGHGVEIREIEAEQ
jgi:hypothetical protein